MSVACAKFAAPPVYYDRIYSQEENYKAHYKDSRYYNLFRVVLDILEAIDDPRILEIGCGTGQLAHMLWDNGIRNYRGFDFSPVAIEMAQARCPEVAFSVCDALEPTKYAGPYNVAIAIEVLEHIEDDLGVLDRIKIGTTVIFSVPSFGCESHVRCFEYERDLAWRYRKQVHFEQIIPLPMSVPPSHKIWLCRGTKI